MNDYQDLRRLPYGKSKLHRRLSSVGKGGPWTAEMKNLLLHQEKVGI